ncbi:MAG: YybS family protein [Clostridioides sp.]|jgi:uncharacterized protein YybS (DUF2232 family)|nr:YybS family protein [Clostridioides sp.]
MEDNIKPRNIFKMVFLAIILAVGIMYVPFFNIISILVVVPYIIVGFDNRYTIITSIITMVFLFFCTGTLYTINIFLAFVIPGMAIGKQMKFSAINGETNQFSPIYLGAVYYIVGMIFLVIIEMKLFNIDILGDIHTQLTTMLNLEMQTPIMEQLGVFKEISVEEVATMCMNLVSTALVVSGFLWAIVVYFLSSFVMRKILKVDFEFGKFRNFYLPKKAVFTAFLMVIVVYILGKLGFEKSDIFYTNLEYIFLSIFFIQGVAVYIYYLIAFIKNKKKTIFWMLIPLLLLGVFGVAIIGISDNIVDLRGLQSNKPA